MITVVSVVRSHPFVPVLEGRVDMWWLAIAGAVPGQMLLCCASKWVTERVWIQTKPPSGNRKGVTVPADRSSHAVDCSPASGCGGTTGVREEEEGSAVCGLGMEWPAGVGMSQTSSAAEASLSSSWATTACFIWKHLVKENKLYFRDGFSTVESHRRPFVSTYVCVLWSRSAPDGREHRALSCLGKMPLQGSQVLSACKKPAGGSRRNL